MMILRTVREPTLRAGLALGSSLFLLLAGCNPSFFPSFSPNEALLAFADRFSRCVYLCDLNQQQIEEIGPGCSPVFTDNHTLIYASPLREESDVTSSTAVYRYDLSARRMRTLCTEQTDSWWWQPKLNERTIIRSFYGENTADPDLRLAYMDTVNGATQPIGKPEIGLDPAPKWISFDGRYWYGALSGPSKSVLLVSPEGVIDASVAADFPPGIDGEREEWDESFAITVSPDGKWLALISHGRPYFRDLSRPEAAWVAGATDQATFLDWSPDSQLLAIGAKRTVLLMEPTGKIRRVWDLPGDKEHWSVPRWSAKGRYLSCAVFVEGNVLTGVIDMRHKQPIYWPSYQVADLLVERLLAEADRLPLKDQDDAFAQLRRLLDGYPGYPRAAQAYYELLRRYLAPASEAMDELRGQFPDSPEFSKAKELFINHAFEHGSRFGRK